MRWEVYERKKEEKGPRYEEAGDEEEGRWQSRQTNMSCLFVSKLSSDTERRRDFD